MHTEVRNHVDSFDNKHFVSYENQQINLKTKLSNFFFSHFSYMISYVWNADPFKDTSNLIFRGRNRIQIGVVICNDEAVNLFKTLSSSLALMSISEIDVHIVVDGDQIKKEVENQAIITLIYLYLN